MKLEALSITVLTLLLLGCLVFAEDALDPSAWYYSCFDSEASCPDQVKNGSCLGMVTEDGGRVGFSFQLGLWMLANCRESCVRFYEENEGRIQAGLRRFYHLMSAGNETFTDLFGKRHQVCDLRHEFTHRAR